MKKKYIYGLSAVAVVIPLALVAHAGSGHGWGKHGWGHGGSHGGKGEMRRMCNPDRLERMEGRQALMARYVGIEDDQRDEWEALKTVRKTNVEATLGLCEELKAEGRTKSMSAKLAKKERILSLKLENVKRLRPAAEAFEAVLNDEQKAAIKELRRHMKGKRWGKRQRWHGGNNDHENGEEYETTGKNEHKDD